jgi:hypothetical protein
LAPRASFHSLANTVDSDGGVYGWGGETPGQLSLISDYGVQQDRSSHSFNVLQPVVLSLFEGRRSSLRRSKLWHWQLVESIRFNLKLFARGAAKFLFSEGTNKTKKGVEF